MSLATPVICFKHDAIVNDRCIATVVAAKGDNFFIYRPVVFKN